MDDWYNGKCRSAAGIRFFLLLALFAQFAVITQAIADPEVDGEKTERTKAVFGPECEELLIKEINRAETEILVAIYSITRRNITSALVSATKRGVTVRVKYDAKSYEWKGMTVAIGYLKKRDVQCTPVQMTGKYAKMHHKFMIIDRKRVLTGSYNYTSAGSTENYENLVLIESAQIAKAFAAEFERIKDG